MTSSSNGSAWRHVAIIGGGVAGTATAIRLRDHGIAVTIIEQAVFPRTKVCGCCIGGAGLDLIEHLHCKAEVRRAARPLTNWLGSINGRRIHIPLKDNIAISRKSLDCILLDRASLLGANIVQPAVADVQSIDDDVVMIRIKRPNESPQVESFDGVVLAGGLNTSGLHKGSAGAGTSGAGSSGAGSSGAGGSGAGNVGDWLPWRTSPHGPFGVSFLVDDVVGFPEDAITMVCEADGYVGMVLLEDGRLDVAAALRSGKSAARSGKPAERVTRLIANSPITKGSTWFDERAFASATNVQTTPPLRRSRLAGRGRMIAVGDAAGYVEPFTGEGMTWAMAGGIAAADRIAGATVVDYCQESASNHLPGDGWPRELERLLKAQRRGCSILSSALHHDVSRILIGQLLSLFPAVGKPVLRHLGKPIPFPRLAHRSS